MKQHLDLHKELLDLSDAIGDLNRQILGAGDSSMDVCGESRALNDEYQARLDEYNKEKLRRKNESRGKEGVNGTEDALSTRLAEF